MDSRPITKPKTNSTTNLLSSSIDSIISSRNFKMSRNASCEVLTKQINKLANDYTYDKFTPKINKRNKIIVKKNTIELLDELGRKTITKFQQIKTPSSSSELAIFVGHRRFLSINNAVSEVAKNKEIVNKLREKSSELSKMRLAPFLDLF